MMIRILAISIFSIITIVFFISLLLVTERNNLRKNHRILESKIDDSKYSRNNDDREVFRCVHDQKSLSNTVADDRENENDDYNQESLQDSTFSFGSQYTNDGDDDRPRTHKLLVVSNTF